MHAYKTYVRQQTILIPSKTFLAREKSKENLKEIRKESKNEDGYHKRNNQTFFSNSTPSQHSATLISRSTLAPPTHIHIILYFDCRRRSPDLKRSFSETLAIYYPLAGRLRDNSRVDCNDEGAEYVEARFDGVRISDVIGNRHTEGLSEYVPLVPTGGANVPLAVQVSFFGCGGAAVGVCMSHKVADAASMVAFVNTWAAACSGDGEKIAKTRPSFDVSSRFIPTDFSEFFKSVVPSGPPPQKIVTKIFTFDGEKLAALKKAASGPLMENPTKVEAVSAFIWKNLIDSAAAENPSHKENLVFTAGHPVDIRQRASPPLPQNFFGNACARAVAVTETVGPSPAQDYYTSALKLRQAIKKTDADHAKRLEDGGAFLKYLAVNEENDPALREGGKTLETCYFTSWSRLPAYEADFGVGKPVWVSIIEVPMKNLMFLLGTKTGDGIEAWVNMVEEGVAMIDANFNLLHV